MWDSRWCYHSLRLALRESHHFPQSTPLLLPSLQAGRLSWPCLPAAHASPLCPLLAEVHSQCIYPQGPRLRYTTTALRWSSILRIPRSYFIHPPPSAFSFFPGIQCIVHCHFCMSKKVLSYSILLPFLFCVPLALASVWLWISPCILILWPSASHLLLQADASSCVKWGS